jgi:putative serine protease PepD
VTTAYDPWGVPDQRREPLDPLLSLPDHPSGEWATRPRRTPHPNPRYLGQPASGQPASSRPQPGQPRSGRPQPGPAQPGQPSSGQPQPGQPQPGQFEPFQPDRQRPGQQRVGHPRPARQDGPYLASYSAQAGYPLVAEAGSTPVHGRGRPRLVILGIVLVLLVVAGWQAYRLERVGRDNDKLTAVVAAEQGRSAQLTDRTSRLEKQLAGVFDPEAISSAVLPSVFRVRAGDLTGTAFSIGTKAPAGQANLLTNFHVVESVWNAGNRKVYLERGSDQLTATIVKVNKTKDLALLRAAKKVTGLAPAIDTVKPGQQIVVVGAPLGLEDTVTTGVVSAYRQEDNGPTIQFDAPINPGNSGGPVVDSSNSVLGLATAKAKDAEGIGLAVPIKTACDAFSGVC